METISERRFPLYRADLATVHHLGFQHHADRCAPGILALLQPVRLREGLVVELGCGSGLLTRHLEAAGHHVVATDGSVAMLDVVRAARLQVEAVRQLVLPDDPIPAADAIVSVGHVLNYLHDEEAIERALTNAARALRPEGLLVLDLCDLAYGAAHTSAPYARVEHEWAIIVRFLVLSRDRLVREITTFLRDNDGTWRRDDERHENVLIDSAKVHALLSNLGLDAAILPSFGDESLPAGVVAVVARRTR